jgi:hypothetical protein
MTPLKLWCGPIVILALLPRPAYSPPQAPEASPRRHKSRIISRPK